jgi:PAS domain S-box-containing protein
LQFSEFYPHLFVGVERHLLYKAAMALDYHNLSRRELVRLLEIRDRRLARADSTLTGAANVKLRENENRFRKFTAVAFEGLCLSERGRIFDVNDRFIEMFGFKREELMGRKILTLIAPKWRAIIAKRIRTGPETLFEHELLRKDGSVFAAEAKSKIISWRGRSIRVTALRDITEWKKREHALSENQRVLATLMSNLPGMVYRCQNNIEWTMEFVSEGCRELTGYAPDDLLGNRKLSYGQVTHPDDQPHIWNAVQAAIKKRRPFELTYRIRTAAKEEKWVWERGRGIFSEKGKLLALEGFITDITDLHQAEQERAEAQAREASARAEYTLRLLASQEAERSRIAAELHDSLGQNLLLIKNHSQLALLQTDLPNDAREQFNRMGEIALEAINEVRQITRDLHPYQLDHLGLTLALEAMIDNAAESSGIIFHRKLDPVDKLFTKDAAMNFYRAMQEILNNILKHSRAQSVRVNLERDVREIQLRIDDDGCGFSVKKVGKNGNGLGLKNIAERMRILGGKMEIRSRTKRGTRMIVTIPTPKGGKLKLAPK